MKGRTTHVVMKALVYAEIQVVISLMKSRMRESRTSGSVRGGGSNPPVYSTHYRLGAVNNQNFVQIPFSLLRWIIKYKAEEHGIAVIEQEESYTSKASF